MKTIQLLKQDIRIPLLLFRTFLSSFFPAMAFITVYMMHDLGLSLLQIMLLQSVFRFSVAFFEVPTGVIGDKYSRKLSLITGSFLFILGWSIYLFKLKFIFYAFAEFLMGIAHAFKSGSDNALQYDTLKEDKLEKYYPKFVSMNRIAVLLASITGGLFSAIFYSKIGLRGIWLVSVFIVPVEILNLVLIKEPEINSNISKDKPNYSWYLKQMFTTLRPNKFLQLLVFLLLIFSQVRYFAKWATQPLFLYFHVPIKYFGTILLTVISILGIILHYILIKYKNKITLRFAGGILIANMLLFDIGMLLAKIVGPSAIILTIIVFRLISQEFESIFQSLIHPFISSEIRATVLSGISLMRSLIFSMFNPFLGYLMDVYLFRGSLVFVTTLMLLSLFFYSRAIKIQVQEH